MPSSEQSHRIGWSIATDRYHPDMIDELKKYFSRDECLEISTRTFQSGMPLFLVQSADRAMLVTWINGDNWASSFAETVMISDGLTGSPDIAGPNTSNLTILCPFIDGRQDKRTLKPIPESIHMAVTKSQFVSTEAIAKAFSAVGCQTFVTTDFHSYDGAQAFENAGTQFINLTAIPLFAETIRNKGLLKDNIETIVGTTDIGDLNRAVPMSRYLGLPIAIVHKTNIPNADGTDRNISQHLIYGDAMEKRVILIDDIISSAKTLLGSVDLYTKLGAKEFVICATHPVCVDNYYDNLLTVLKNPRVKLIMTTNTLPLKRLSGEITLPYTGMGENRKQIEILDIGSFVASSADIILHAPDIATAKQQLGTKIWDMQDPFKLSEQITGISLERPLIKGIYLGQGIFSLFPDSGAPSSST